MRDSVLSGAPFLQNVKMNSMEQKYEKLSGAQPVFSLVLFGSWKCINVSRRQLQMRAHSALEKYN